MYQPRLRLPAFTFTAKIRVVRAMVKAVYMASMILQLKIYFFMQIGDCVFSIVATRNSGLIGDHYHQ